jgi:hypothetical protein
MVRALGENLLRVVRVDDKFEMLAAHEIAIAGKPAPTVSLVCRQLVAIL